MVDSSNQFIELKKTITRNNVPVNECNFCFIIKHPFPRDWITVSLNRWTPCYAGVCNYLYHHAGKRVWV